MDHAHLLPLGGVHLEVLVRVGVGVRIRVRVRVRDRIRGLGLGLGSNPNPDLVRVVAEGQLGDRAVEAPPELLR